MSVPTSSAVQPAEHDAPRVRKAYVPAVGPRLKKLLYVILAMVAVLGANSIYLAAITAWSWASGRSYEDWFYQWMFLAHLVLGLVFVAPFVLFAVAHLLNTRKRKNRRCEPSKHIGSPFAPFRRRLARIVPNARPAGNISPCR